MLTVHLPEEPAHIGRKGQPRMMCGRFMRVPTGCKGCAAPRDLALKVRADFMENSLRDLTGMAIGFIYPRRDCSGQLVAMERRRLSVTSFREVAGREMATGMDIDRQAERSFWTDEMEGIEQLEVLPEPEPACCVVVVDDRGVETVPRPVMRAAEALVYAEAWNQRTAYHKCTATIRHRGLACLTRNPLGKVE